MDCPSEENLIRLKLGSLNISQLDFNIPNRTLFVFHDENHDTITNALNELNLGASLKGTEEVPTNNENHFHEKRLLWTVLLINLIFFIVELVIGFFARSMGLVADSLDMLADALIYALSLYAIGHTIQKKKRIAKISGYFQMLLAVLGFLEVIRRCIDTDGTPNFFYMIIISILALTGNAACLFLLQKSKNTEAHMQASIIFTNNDVIINLGVILAGVFVYFTNSIYPDLLVGCVVFILVVKGAVRILKIAR